MKKIIIALMTIIIVICSGNISNASNTNISDIDTHWAKENILKMIANGNVNGYPDGTFKPNNEVTTLEFIKIIINTLGIDKNTIKEWPDYYISAAHKFGLPDNYYEAISRYEATEIISKFMDLKNVSIGNNRFKDVDSKYKSNILKLANLQIINGYEDKTFRGNQKVTRAEAITIALRVLQANKKIIGNKKYDLDEKYTNYGFDVTNEREISKIRYEIKNGKIFFADEGRFSYLSNYSIIEKYVTNKKIIELIKILISEDSYTAVYYVPSEYIINQIIIRFGEDDICISRGLDYFSLTYYEDKLYDLKRITLKDGFSSECYMKIDIKKLWNDIYDFEKGDIADEYIKEKLLKVLKIEFEANANKIFEYILDKYNKEMNNEYKGKVIVEQETFGKYIVNFYKTDATSLEFYIEKLSS